MYKISFAPLQGYTEDAYRRIHNRVFGGVAEYYTPFVRLEHGNVRSKDMRDIRPEFNEGVNVIPQIIASDAAEMQTLIDVIAPLGYSRVDVNMGCPFPLQTRHGRGAGLLLHHADIKDIASLMLKYDNVKFSVKMRLGMDAPDQWREAVEMLDDVPLEHIAVHPRIATQQYKGELHLSEFENLLSATRHKVIYNGDIRCVSDIEKLESRYGDRIDGVMIGRGLLARPSLAKEYAEGMTMSDDELLGKICEMHDMLHEHFARMIPGEAQQLNKLRTFWDYMEETVGRKQWKKLQKAGNMKNYLTIRSSVR